MLNIDNLQLNNMDYSMPASNSLVTNRVNKRNYFQNRNYSEGQTMIAQFNTGTDCVNVKNSKLVLKVTLQANSFPTLASFGVGSACNLIKNIRIYHRSGTTYTNTIKYNLYRSKVDHVKQSKQWFSSVGEPIMGYNEGVIFKKNIPSQADSVSHTLEIPLNLVHPFFEPLSDCQLPPQMASGLRVEIDLETVRNAFTIVSGSNPEYGSPLSYTIDDVYFDLESSSLMDSAAATLNTVAQTKNLEYLYYDVFTSQNSISTGVGSVNIDINKSVALADNVIGCYQLAGAIGTYQNDSFATHYVDNSSWWYQLGSNQYPLQKIDNSTSAYHNALVTYNRLVEPISALTGNGFLNYYAIYAQTLERDSTMALSSSPVNASRSLRFELSMDSVYQNTLFTIYLTYLTSARSTLLNSRVDI
jgi:hypothetical protein